MRKNRMRKKNSSRPRASTQVVAVPGARATTSLARRPRVQQGRGKASDPFSVEISHRELLTPVFSVTADGPFASYEVNPGLVGSFPWLSLLATNFEAYEFLELEYEYVPSVGTSEDGTITIVPMCDSDTPTVPSRNHGMSYVNATSTQVYNRVKCRFPKDALKWIRNRLVRAGGLGAAVSLTASGDASFYDVGRIAYLALGSSAKYMGDLYVSYRVKLSNPIRSALYEYAQSWSARITAASAAAPFYGSVAEGAGAALVGIPAGNRLQFAEAGDYLVDIHADGPGIVSVLPPAITATTGLTWSLLNDAQEAGSSSIWRYSVKTLSDFLNMDFDFSTAGSWTGTANVIVQAARAAESVLEFLSELSTPRRAARYAGRDVSLRLRGSGTEAPTGPLPGLYPWESQNGRRPARAARSRPQAPATRDDWYEVKESGAGGPGCSPV